MLILTTVINIKLIQQTLMNIRYVEEIWKGPLKLLCLILCYKP